MITTHKKTYLGKHDIMLLDLDSGEKLYLQGLPSEIEHVPETTWATIKPFGRNNPHYHFTGSEDTINISISWFSEEKYNFDVIERCKWIESLMKADGYLGRPHRVALIWGHLYRDQMYIIQSGSYKLGGFNQENGYRPTRATQEVVLKRVTNTNLTLKEVLNFR